MSQLVDCTGTEIICGNCIALTGDGWNSADQSDDSVSITQPIRGEGCRSSPPSDDVLWWTLPGNPWHQWPETRGSQPITAQYSASVANQEWGGDEIKFQTSIKNVRYLSEILSYKITRKSIHWRKCFLPTCGSHDVFINPPNIEYVFSGRSHAWWSLDCFLRHV